jgi:hypothetical protein
LFGLFFWGVALTCQKEFSPMMKYLPFWIQAMSGYISALGFIKGTLQEMEKQRHQWQ